MQYRAIEYAAKWRCTAPQIMQAPKYMWAIVGGKYTWKLVRKWRVAHIDA